MKYKDLDVSFRLAKAEKEAALISAPSRSQDLEPTPEEKTRFEKVAEQSPRAAVLGAVVSTQSSSQVKAKIAVISALLDEIVTHVLRANVPENEQILTKIERQQLIAVLETALAVLKSPMVEKGLIKQTAEIVKKGAASALEKGVQQGLGLAMTQAGHRLLELLNLIK
ncbi:MAG: hypothetical protein ACTHK9_11165 [Nitrobacter sp.]|jgi:hypothetical protein